MTCITSLKLSTKLETFLIFGLFISLSEKMQVFDGTGNLCPKKSGGKLSLKKKKKKKKKTRRVYLALYHVCIPQGGKGGLYRPF